MKPKKEIPRYKTGTCTECGKENTMLTAGRCINSPYCYKKHRAAISNEKKQNSLTGAEIEPKKVYTIPNQSDKRKKLDAVYKILRDRFMKGKLCQANWSGCTKIATECHHAAGRLGGNMLDSSTYRALCHNCHVKVEAQPDRAKKEGLSINRL